MTTELAKDTAMHELHVHNYKLNNIMRQAKKIAKMNSHRNGEKLKYAPSEISLAKFIDHVQTNKEQHEKDLVTVSTNLQNVWKILHLSIQALGEDPYDYELEMVTEVMHALKNLGLTNLVTENLNAKIVAWAMEL